MKKRILKNLLIFMKVKKIYRLNNNIETLNSMETLISMKINLSDILRKK